MTNANSRNGHVKQSETIELPDELRGVIDELESSYWVPFLKTPFNGLARMCDALRDSCPALYEVLLAFSTNLHSAQELLEFPYMLLAPYMRDDGTIQRYADAKSSAKSDGEHVSLIDEQLAIFVAKQSVELGVKHLGNRKVTSHIMHQACVLTWSAFETLCKEVFIRSLNQRPDLFANIQTSQSLKERFAVSHGSWPKLLEAHGFNLNGKLGTIIASDKDFSSPQLLRDVFDTLFKGLPGSPELLSFFKNDALWLLGQRRHLIAHKCGIVDQEYLDKTGDSSQCLGELLRLRGRDIAESMGMVAQCAVGLAAQANYCWPESDVGTPE